MYNNPYIYQNLYKQNFFSKLFNNNRNYNINWGNILNNTQKSLGIINQAIPIIHQVRPIINNAKTMFKIVGAIKNNNKNTDIKYNTQNNEIQNTNKPIFYI